MFDEQQRALRTKHAPDLGECLRDAVDAAKNERGHDCVERVVPKRQCLCGCLDDGRLAAAFTEPVDEQAPHVRVGLGENEPHARRVVLQVQAGAGADLQHVALEAGEKACAPVAQAGVLGAAQAAVVRGSEESGQRHELALVGFRRLRGELPAELLDSALSCVELRDA